MEKKTASGAQFATGADQHALPCDQSSKDGQHALRFARRRHMFAREDRCGVAHKNFDRICI
jgi:hypothetical protein